MIKKLKIKFIRLAMISLALLLAFIVAGMNIINYNNVIRDADGRIDVIEQNADRFSGEMEPIRRFDEDDKFFGKGGRRDRFMTMDEAEEARFFTVVTDSNGEVINTNMDRIAAVDSEQAEEFAQKALSENRDHGFVGEFRYSVNDLNGNATITFLDCGRVLASYRNFLIASIIMSLAGLLVVFAAITYFAGRIVKPVAESYDKQKRFITDAGHEIKTPLAIIKANLDLIDMDPESTDESLEEIGNQVDRLAGLTDDLVYLSRMEESAAGPVMSELPISEIAGESLASFEVLASENGKRIEADIEPMLSAYGSVKDIERLFSILLENAVKYSVKEEPIKVSLRRDGKNVLYEVVNKTYEQISEDEVEHVFDRFYRTDESRNSATGGYGIGLSMAKAIVTACGGKISASTSDGKDFRVLVSFKEA